LPSGSISRFLGKFIFPDPGLHLQLAHYCDDYHIRNTMSFTNPKSSGVLRTIAERLAWSSSYARAYSPPARA
jgi:hypothetical protein